MKHDILFYGLQIHLVIYCYEFHSTPSDSSGTLCVLCTLLQYVCKMNSLWQVKWHFYRIQIGSKNFYVLIKGAAKFLEGENKQTESNF